MQEHTESTRKSADSGTGLDVPQLRKKFWILEGV
jgi:hypothetical protein